VGELDQEVVAFEHYGPQSGIKHPMSVRLESESVARIVVTADGVLVDVRGLDDGGG